MASEYDNGEPGPITTNDTPVPTNDTDSQSVDDSSVSSSECDTTPTMDSDETVRTGSLDSPVHESSTNDNTVHALYGAILHHKLSGMETRLQNVAPEDVRALQQYLCTNQFDLRYTIIPQTCWVPELLNLCREGQLVRGFHEAVVNTVVLYLYDETMHDRTPSDMERCRRVIKPYLSGTVQVDIVMQMLAPSVGKGIAYPTGGGIPRAVWGACHHGHCHVALCYYKLGVYNERQFMQFIRSLLRRHLLPRHPSLALSRADNESSMLAMLKDAMASIPGHFTAGDFSNALTYHDKRVARFIWARDGDEFKRLQGGIDDVILEQVQNIGKLRSIVSYNFFIQRPTYLVDELERRLKRDRYNKIGVKGRHADDLRALMAESESTRGTRRPTHEAASERLSTLAKEYDEMAPPPPIRYFQSEDACTAFVSAVASGIVMGSAPYGLQAIAIVVCICISIFILVNPLGLITGDVEYKETVIHSVLGYVAGLILRTGIGFLVTRARGAA